MNKTNLSNNFHPNRKPQAIAIDWVLEKEENRRRGRGPNDNDPLKYIGWVIAGILLLWLMCQSVFAQSNLSLKVEGETWQKGTKIALSDEIYIEANFVIKRIKVLRKIYNEYRLESFINVNPPAKVAGLVLSASANKIKSGDEVQLLLIPENESLKLSDNESTFYFSVK